LLPQNWGNQQQNLAPSIIITLAVAYIKILYSTEEPCSLKQTKTKSVDHWKSLNFMESWTDEVYYCVIGFSTARFNMYSSGGTL